MAVPNRATAKYRHHDCAHHRLHRLMWDNGVAPTAVVAYGIADPGDLYTGELPSAATMINEPLRRYRVAGTDLLGRLSADVPLE